jgi:hypothetical protein
MDETADVFLEQRTSVSLFDAVARFVQVILFDRIVDAASNTLAQFRREVGKSVPDRDGFETADSNVHEMSVQAAGTRRFARHAAFRPVLEIRTDALGESSFKPAKLFEGLFFGYQSHFAKPAWRITAIGVPLAPLLAGAAF